MRFPDAGLAQQSQLPPTANPAIEATGSISPVSGEASIIPAVCERVRHRKPVLTTRRKKKTYAFVRLLRLSGPDALRLRHGCRYTPLSRLVPYPPRFDR